ncbi:MAG: Uma2 family endonuclease [Oscillatoriales cyanobacterium RM2_1_1]|nr:Uma2 family endonuclease [Oscillatoriales cyanobacterium RM2_1_1]
MQTIDSTPATQLYVTPEIFDELCKINPDLRLECTAQGELIVNPPTGGDTGASNAGLTAKFWNWNEKNRPGKIFDSSTGFKLPNGATRSPDVSWVRLDRWNALTPEQRRGFIPLAPDFVLELMSPSDNLSNLQEKMQEYLENGVLLGWLVNPDGKTVEIYRPGQAVQVVPLPCKLRGEAVLPGFELEI